MMFTQRSALAWFPAGCWVLTPAHKAPHSDLRGQSPASGFPRPSVPFAPPPHSQAYPGLSRIEPLLASQLSSYASVFSRSQRAWAFEPPSQEETCFLHFSLKRDKITNDRAQAGGLANISDIVLPESAQGSSVHFPRHYFIRLKIFKQ